MTVKLLFIYPTPFRVTGLPVGIASITSVLKEKDVKVKIFDTAFYPGDHQEDQTKLRSDRLMSKEIRDEESVLPNNTTKMETDLINLIYSYKPDLIGISILEVMYDTSRKLADLIKQEFGEIPIIAGGVFPTLSPDIVIEENSIDIVCLGEGETALEELCKRISTKKEYLDVRGLWVKKGGIVHKNLPSRLHDINTLPFPDFSDFDPRLFYKPMQGKMYKMMNIESSRGCVNKCTYCAAPQLRNFFERNDCGRYNRNMKMEKVIEQIQLQIKKHKPEFIYFSSENFLSISPAEFSIFVEEYDKIKIPFWIQTRIETITHDRLNALKRVGMHWMSIGLEHGNEEFRRTVLKRYYSNTVFFEKIKILKELNIGASINNVIGFPGETRELIFDTIWMNRALWQENNKLENNVFVFTPFRGCELYERANEQGLLGDTPFMSQSDLSDETILQFPEEFKNDIKGLAKTFNLYIRLPEEYFEKIRISEEDSSEGNAIFSELSKLCRVS